MDWISNLWLDHHTGTTRFGATLGSHPSLPFSFWLASVHHVVWSAVRSSAALATHGVGTRYLHGQGDDLWMIRDKTLR